MDIDLKKNRFAVTFGLLIIVALTIAAYSPIIDADFVNFDDNLYVTDNEIVKGGLSAKGIRFAFAFQEDTYWHPLTWIAHMTDVMLFGMNPGMHHLTSIWWHLLNVILLFIVLSRTTNTFWRSALVAAVFALHPINVDSVAWIAERKNVLSTFFWLLTMYVYWHYSRKPGIYRYALMLVIFTFGLLVKPMLVTLPCVMLMMDVWPFRRISQFAALYPALPRSEGPTYPVVSLGRAIIEKIPLLVLSLAAVVISSAALKRIGSIVSFDKVPLGLRIENAIVSYIQYAGKVLWPSNFSVYYPYPDYIPIWKTALAGAILVIITVAVIRSLPDKPWRAFGWFWFLGTLFPVIGIIQGGLWPAFADRWAYVPSIGLFLMIAWELAETVWPFIYSRKNATVMATSTCIAVLTVLAALTWRQTGHWIDSVALWEQALSVTVGNETAHLNIGQAYRKKGELDKSIAHYQKALQYNSTSAGTHYSIGMTYEEAGNRQRAIDHLNEALSLKPNYFDVHASLGMVYAKEKEFQDAMEHLNIAVSGEPNNHEFKRSRNQVAMHLTKTREAISHAARRSGNDPGNPKLLYEMGTLYTDIGDWTMAAHYYQKALALDPTNEFLLSNIAGVYYFDRQYMKMREMLLRLIRMNPDNPDTYYQVARSYALEKDPQRAIDWLQKARNKGFSDWHRIAKDTAFDNIRDSDAFTHFVIEATS